MPTQDRKRKAQKKANYGKNKELILAQKKEEYIFQIVPPPPSIGKIKQVETQLHNNTTIATKMSGNIHIKVL